LEEGLSRNSSQSENISGVLFNKTRSRGCRRGSEGDIHNESVRNSNSIRQILTHHRKTLIEIETIKSQLEVIRSCVFLEDLKIGNEIVEIKKQVHSIFKEIESTPRLLSRCDATVGNTQMILSRLIDTKKEIVENISSHDTIVLDMLEMVLKLNNSISSRLERIEKTLKERETKGSRECVEVAAERLCIPPPSPSSSEEEGIKRTISRSTRFENFPSFLSSDREFISEREIEEFAREIGAQ
jgi:hypothetical protein